ncbi:bifunctional oligoribonuclease/PAP phosphatase NrnA [Chlorobaculum thiosulfatiphilum]|jgi:phosphoesterase RecJ-like protein|uniref:Bifunctional oligoribonuclease/PAP phosphatase NrnA n=1 Tax=Chlorobaculum thiosulfatiphilum TaxID=115852 RepID=A0A5C4S770_CHLTI|nr:bifunctional oligoribonuclease/PAP phosphatase NrnA [Chlorobaculum thiosulfatiphilum]NTV82511.1 bifunctional oligoribonuclease/PAP phosphatase NrnA [Chlorobaculum sp.]TNJ39380.1 bifunctional oligoribonuclease/PAP phosphatase NrnA [Chlorobaculum thiosulfatiphilum]
MIIPEYGRTLTPEEWKPVIDEMLVSSHILFTTHENSDGDGLGSQVALALALKALGKEVAIFNPTEVPPNYLFLKELHDIRLFRDRDEESMQEFFLADLLVVLDANLHDRIGRLWPQVEFAREMSRLRVLCIDHHLEPEDFADITVCETYVSSTGELVCDLIAALELRTGQKLFTAEVASALYVAIMTDTGSFRFSKTTPYTYHVAGMLVEKGADPEMVYDRIYNSLTPEALKLLGLALSSIKIIENGLISWLFISQDMLNQTGSKLFDTDLIIRYLLSVPTVKVAVLLVEMQDGRAKVSFRSRGKIYVNQLAKHHGGGGHMNAAGCLLRMSAEKAQLVILEDVRKFTLEQVNS